MDTHPFSPERHIGHIYNVEGSFADVTFYAADKLPRAHYGEYLGRGEVGEFVVIDVEGIAIFGRILRIGTPANRAEELLTESGRNVPVEGRIQLLSTLELSGKATRGISKYPKVGDAVFAASSEAILAVIGTSPSAAVPTLRLGSLSVDESVPVDVPLSRLFGRHVAVVGATGSGKSWTLGHLAESVAALRGKMILIDATGEFRTLGDRAKHFAFGSTAGEPAGAQCVGIPHYMMRESDRNAFLNPSAGSQLPKLREAVRTLRLVQAVADDTSPDPAHHMFASAQGAAFPKTGNSIEAYQSAMQKYIGSVEDAHYPFNFRALADQVQCECIWPTGQNQKSSVFGGPNNNELGYVSSLISRINDLLQIPEVMNVIDPPNGVLNAIDEMESWLADTNSHLLRISLRNLTFTNHLREIIVNILGQTLLGWARLDKFQSSPLVVAVDEAITSGFLRSFEVVGA
jgi:hypothetical protein